MPRWLTSFTLFNIFVLILVLLLSRDPFSGQNAISELEPSPDAIHYLSPVKSLFEGYGFAITYEGRSIPTLVPPLYSLTLIPFYGLFHDIRAFYFLNALLMILSAYILLKVILTVFTNRLIQFLVFLGFCTNYIIFWYPSFPMAENLLIFLTTISFLLLIPPLYQKKAVLVGVIAGLMYATKYVAWVEGFCLIAVYVFQIWRSKAAKKAKIGQGLLVITSLIIALTLAIYFEYLTKGSSVLASITSNIQVVAQLIWHSSSGQNMVDKSSLFYRAPFWDNLTRYLFGLIGGSVTIAGQRYKIIPPIIGMTALLSPVILFRPGTKRYLVFYIMFSILGSLIYLSEFQTVDARYFLAFIPGLILLFGFFLQELVVFFAELDRSYYSKIILAVAIVTLLGFSAPLFAQGLKTNWTHSDTSQNFLAISTLNTYFGSHNFAKKPAVITILSPYQIDFFSRHNYELLPLSKIQYFTNSESQTWGIPKGKAYLEVYREHLLLKQPLFLLAYHVGPDFLFGRDYQTIRQNFSLIKVIDGCNGECNLYQIDSL